MMYDVILRKEQNTYIAQVKEWPEVVVKAESRDRAIRGIKTQLLDYLTRQIEIVRIDVPLPKQEKIEWRDAFGWFANDPTFENMECEIAAYRHELDAKAESGVK